MNLKEVAYFIELVENENFTKAATNLMISQPALSKAIKMLEYDLGLTLIDRECNKKFKLTNEGKIFYENAKITLENINNEINNLKDCMKECKNNLTIGIPPIMGIIYFTPIIAEFKKKYKNIHIKIIENGSREIKNKVINQECDLGITVSNCKTDTLESIKLKEENVALVVYKGHKFSERKEIIIEELENENLIILNKQFYLNQKILNELHKKNIPININLETTQWYFIMQMVIFKEGISILPEKIIDRFKTDDLYKVKIQDNPIKLDINYIYNKNKKISTPMNLFIQHLNKSIF